MSNFDDWDDDDLEFDNENEQPRKANDENLVKQLRKAQREAEKRFKAAEAELAEYRKERRVNSIKSVLSERGLNPLVADFIPSEIEANADAVASWLDKYGEIFGGQQVRADQPDLSALRQIDQVTGNAQIPVGDDELSLRLSQATSADEIINMIYGQQ